MRRVLPLKHYAFLAAIVILADVLTLAHAGVVDSPLPAPFTQHVFTVPGVFRTGGLGSFFACTNLASSPVTVGVEVFDNLFGVSANDAAATSLTIDPGRMKLFGTDGAIALAVDSLLNTTPLNRGSARILATSKKIACTAFVADVSSAPPTGWQLTIIKKGTTQKAAN